MTSFLLPVITDLQHLGKATNNHSAKTGHPNQDNTASFLLEECFSFSKERDIFKVI